MLSPEIEVKSLAALEKRSKKVVHLVFGSGGPEIQARRGVVFRV
jgi:hypothetical protein